MTEIPNPLGNSFEVSSIAETEELLKIGIFALVGIGFLVCWLQKILNDLGKTQND
jgi:hypothetical protein